MVGLSLTPDEFEDLIATSIEDYDTKVPSWISNVQPLPLSGSLEDMLDELKQSLQTTSRYERALRSAGVPIPQDIPYNEARKQVEELTARLQTSADLNECNLLSQELEKFSAALMASDEYKSDLLEKERQWEEDQLSENEEALAKILRHMPTDVRLASEQTLHEDHGIPKPIARKFKRTDILQLLRKNPDEIVKAHPSTFDQYKTTGLTLTERRALHVHLRPVGQKWGKMKDSSTERKLIWFNMLKSKFRHMVSDWDRHMEQHGCPTSHHKCDRLGNQCPFKANSLIEYSGDFGFPGRGVYEAVDVTTVKDPVFMKSSIDLSQSSPIRRKSEAMCTTPPQIAPKKKVGEKVTTERPSIAEIFAQKDRILKDSSQQDNEVRGQPSISESRPERSPLPPPPPPRSMGSSNGSSLRLPGAPASPLRKLVRFSPKLEGPPPKTVEEQRQLHLEEHYIGQPSSRLAAARKSYSSILKVLDLIESGLNEWIDRMVTSSREASSPTDDDKEREKNDFLKHICSVEKVVMDLSERVKWTSRSVPECEIAEDLVKAFGILANFIVGRMKEMGIKEKAVKKKLKGVNEALDMVHGRNIKTLKKLGVDKAQPTRRVRSISEIAHDKLNASRKKKKKKKIRNNPNSSTSKVDKVLPEPPFHSELTKQETHSHEPITQEGHDRATVKAQECPPSKTEDAISKNINMPGTDNAKAKQDVDYQLKLPENQKENLNSNADAPSLKGHKENLAWQLEHQIQSAKRNNKRLENALSHAGVAIPDESIPYQVAEAKVREISEEMTKIGYGNPAYFQLEQEMEKYSTALLSSEEYKKELERREEEWEEANSGPNRLALAQVRAHMPVEVNVLSEKELADMTTPSGKVLPKTFARRFKRSNVLQLLRLNPNNIERLHFANLESLSLSGLSVIERRALYQHLKILGPRWTKSRSDPAVERKLMWFNQMKDRFKQELSKYEDMKGPQGAGIDYSGDYGFPQDDTYMAMEIAKEERCNLVEQAKQESLQAVREGMDYWERRL